MNAPLEDPALIYFSKLFVAPLTNTPSPILRAEVKKKTDCLRRHVTAALLAATFGGQGCESGSQKQHTLARLVGYLIIKGFLREQQNALLLDIPTINSPCLITAGM